MEEDDEQEQPEEALQSKCSPDLDARRTTTRQALRQPNPIRLNGSSINAGEDLHFMQSSNSRLKPPPRTSRPAVCSSSKLASDQENKSSLKAQSEQCTQPARTSEALVKPAKKSKALLIDDTKPGLLSETQLELQQFILEPGLCQSARRLKPPPRRTRSDTTGDKPHQGAHKGSQTQEPTNHSELDQQQELSSEQRGNQCSETQPLEITPRCTKRLTPPPRRKPTRTRSEPTESTSESGQAKAPSTPPAPPIRDTTVAVTDLSVSARVWDTQAALQDRAKRMEEQREKAVLLASCTPDPSVRALPGRKKNFDHVGSRLLDGTSLGKEQDPKKILAKTKGSGQERFHTVVAKVASQRMQAVEEQHAAAARLSARGSRSGTVLAKLREQQQREAEAKKRQQFRLGAMAPRSRLLAQRQQRKQDGSGSSLAASERMHRQAMEARLKVQKAAEAAAVERQKFEGSFEVTREFSTL
eukprot:COSAG02_NODE_12018_length_1612_cov_1.765367_1_plen_471_part_00